MNKTFSLAAWVLPLVLASASAGAQSVAKETKEDSSPWLVAPLVSTSPKMGTSVGGLGAYLHRFDSTSQTSMFGLAGQYSTTHSVFAGLFARTSFGADHHRLDGLVGFGQIENEYKDYLGTGQTFRTTDNLRMVVSRYLYRVGGSWFAGAQGAFVNYQVTGASAAEDDVLEMLGITGVRSGGLGLVLMHDSRDHQDMPTRGWYVNLNNLANREALGAEDDYETYRVDLKFFVAHGRGHVMAVRQNNQFSVNAPASAEATVLLRGYKIEQYLAKYMSSLEGEERLRFSRRWGATLFAGVARLYGGSASAADSDGYYPSYGAGLQFVLKPEDRMLLNLEYGKGDKDNYGVYLRVAYAW